MQRHGRDVGTAWQDQVGRVVGQGRGGIEYQGAQHACLGGAEMRDGVSARDVDVSSCGRCEAHRGRGGQGRTLCLGAPQNRLDGPQVVV